MRRAAATQAAADHLERRVLDRRGGLHARDAHPRAVGDRCGRPGGAPPRIVATDISTEAVRAARRRPIAVAASPRCRRGRASAGSSRRPAGGWAVRDEVRRLVDVRVHNLVTDPPPFGPGEVDLVVCRNVTIYFSRETTRSLIGGFHDVLAEGGYLLLGHSETLWQVSDAFTLVPMGEAFVYRRTADVRSRTAANPSKTPTSGTASASRVAVHAAASLLRVDHLAAARAGARRGRLRRSRAGG